MGGSIEVISLGKNFRRLLADRPTTLQEVFMRGLRGLGKVDEFWALRDISFSVPPGKVMGVIGPNGAGKSTLLRLIGGVGRPDEGRVETRGRIGALLSLGAGFHGDLTGRENVMINGVISGLSRQEVFRRFDSIVEFSELERFIDSPLRTYSAGMQMRLAFAIAVHIEPEVLLIDEVLAVGDMAFQKKCISRIERFKSQGCTILLVSHDHSFIRDLCDEAIWLRAGSIVTRGPAPVVVDQYVNASKNDTERRTPHQWPARRTAGGRELRINVNRIGSMEMEITDVRLKNLQGDDVREFRSGSALCVEIRYECGIPIESPIFEVLITKEDDSCVYHSSTETSGIVLPTLHGKGEIAVVFDRLDLTGEQYYVDVGVYRKDWSWAYDYHWHVYPFTVRAELAVKGVLLPPHQWKLDHLQGSAPPADPPRRGAE
jgi:lipopolysaccharide transport system ATP-binding protein